MNQLKAKDFKAALISGSFALMNNRGKIDALNVFPVPDGDTGSNMSGTVKSAITDIENFDVDNIGELAKKFARGALLGARGNSGVILSQIFKGFSVALEGEKQANTFDLVEAFKQAKIFAYKSVMKPVEGTLLTVIRLVAEDLAKSITPSNDVLTVFAKAVEAARKACDLTPSLLPILKEVGVTDSGGEGFWLILDGMHKSLQGKPVKSEKDKSGDESREFIFGLEEEYDDEFGYCTECVVELKKPEHFDQAKFQSGLEKFGNSIVIVRDEEILKIHVHSIKPGAVFNYAQKYGEFIKLKSENMTLQANQSRGQKASKETTNQELNPINNGKSNGEAVKIGVISCNDGRGLIEEMKELGVDIIIEGGQTNNPSTRDFLSAISEIKTKNIIILPNNSNIILVAQQVVQTVQDKKIIIVPTKSQVEGIAAMFNFDRDNTLEENQELMVEGVEAIKTGQVTTAIKDTKINGVNIKKGHYLGIANKEVISSTDSKINGAIAIVNKLANEETEIITIWYGENASKIDAQEVATYIESNYEAVVEVKNGGQHIYDFLISFE